MWPFFVCPALLMDPRCSAWGHTEQGSGVQSSPDQEHELTAAGAAQGGCGGSGAPDETPLLSLSFLLSHANYLTDLLP